jgi:hypothetical protein
VQVLAVIRFRIVAEDGRIDIRLKIEFARMSNLFNRSNPLSGNALCHPVLLSGVVAALPRRAQIPRMKSSRSTYRN